MPRSHHEYEIPTDKEGPSYRDFLDWKAQDSEIASFSAAGGSVSLVIRKAISRPLTQYEALSRPFNIEQKSKVRPS
jgi:hypothetical protein